MNSVSFHIQSEEESIQFGLALGRLLRAGDVVGLCGDLGAGKTFLCRSICEGIGVPSDETVNSPTFTLINEYAGGPLPVYHMDLYRLNDPRDLYELGLWEYYEGAGVCLVEWFDRFSDLWPAEALALSIHLEEGDARVIEVRGEGRGAGLAEQLRGACSVFIHPS